VAAQEIEPFLRSTKFLAEYPRQVILAKQTDVTAGLRGRKKGMKKRLSDGKRTGAFRKWCKTRPGIMVGNKAFEDWRIQARKEAEAHLSAILVNIAKFKDDLEQHANRYTNEELRVIRVGEPLSSELSGRRGDHGFWAALRRGQSAL
jgi:hypothetical protein